MNGTDNCIIKEIVDIKLAKPHKLILLLAVANLFKQGRIHDKKVLYNIELQNEFSSLLGKYGTSDDRNRPYNPFFHLRTFSFWTLIPVDGMQKLLSQINSIGGPGELTRLVQYAELADDFVDILSDNNQSFLLRDLLITKLKSYSSPAQQGEIQMNPFVSYLNSLHCADAGSKGALAEAQSLDPLFCEIHVSHPWSGEIFNLLTGSDRARVILSGHAGDGKSTLAVEIIKRLRNISTERPLPTALGKREEIPYHEHTVVVIKDLSEWTKDERRALFIELMEDSDFRYLMVSNTGALLDFFKANADDAGAIPVELENSLLTALDASGCQKMAAGGHSFQIYNLAQLDNINLAMEMFDKMVQSAKWADCGSCPQYGRCPVAANLQILRKYRELVRERLELLYSRAYAYGARLTMRQISAHFAYMLTSGTDCKKIAVMLSAGKTLQPACYSFVNRFWGDDGVREDANAAHLQAVKTFCDERFNTRFLPSQERKFWLTVGNGFMLNVPEMEQTLRRLEHDAVKNDGGNPALAARRGIRRLAYFLFTPNDTQYARFGHFLCTFLNSPSILDSREWKTKPGSFKPRDLQTSLFRVLQEQFCGVRPPEGKITDWELYLTLNRQSSDIRQSSQLVLRHFRFPDKFEIKLVNGEPCLTGIHDLTGVSLLLTLPFLDYILERKSGRLGRGLQLAYRNRLENFMAQILRKLPDSDQRTITLLKQGEDESLSIISVKINNQTLEVLQ